MISIKRILLLFLLISFSNYSQEKDLIVNPYAGISFPTGNLKDFSKNGFVIGTSVDYYVWKKLGFGLDFNYQNNNYSFPYSIPNVSNPFSLSQSKDGNWSTSTLTLGPTYRIGTKKLSADIYSKAGISYTKSPENIMVLSNNGFSKSIFNLPSQERTSFGLTSGIRFNYKLSDRFSIFINPQYVFSTAKIDYCNCGVENSSNPDDLINAQPIKETIKPSYFNLNGGISYLIGKNHNKKNDEETNANCFKTKLLAPYNDEIFNLNNRLPEFVWTNKENSIKEFILNIYVNEEIIYKTSTKESSFKFDKKSLEIFEKDFNKNYKWSVSTFYKDCPAIESPKQSFSVSRSGSFHDVIDIECRSPFYNEDGSINYTAKIKFFNNISVSDPLIIQNLSDIQITTPSGVTITNFNSCNNSFPAFPMPLIIQPGPSGNRTICFDFTVPSGTNSIRSEVVGYILGVKQDSREDDSLKSCICNICDENNPNGWQINNITNSFSNIGNFPDEATAMFIRSSFKIMNANPIQEVKAQIISVEHKVNDKQCYLCTKETSKLGLFKDGTGKALPNNGWLNNGNASIYDENYDSYGNELIWKAQTILGVDFTNQKSFQMLMSLPKLSNLSCCNSVLKVCIRYTFTDINCQSCDTLVCYEYDSTDSSSNNNGEIETGIENQSVGETLTPIQLTQKK